MKRKTIILKVFLSFVILVSCILIKANVYVNSADEISLSEKGDIAPLILKGNEEAALYEESLPFDIKSEEYMAEGDKRNLLINDPEPIFKANSEVESFFDINLRIDEEYLNSVGATVTIKEVMKYSNYLARFEEDISTAISLDCQVWVLQVHYPGEYKTRGGMFRNAIVTGLYDAETGSYHGFSLTAEECIETYSPYDTNSAEWKDAVEQQRLLEKEQLKEYGIETLPDYSLQENQSDKVNNRKK